MWREGLLYRINSGLIALALCAVMILTAWAGYRLAIWRERKKESPTEIGPIEASIAGLLALVLAFSFGIASQRFDTRQTIIVTQANAIETAFLRCSVLDADDRAYCEDRLRAYVDVFVAYGAAPHDREKIDALVREAEAISHALWARMATIARERPTPVNATLLTGLNEVIDRASDREGSMRIIVPEEVTAVLLFLSVLWAAIGGFAYGLKRNDKPVAWVVFAVLVSLVVFVTLDLDRPRRGFIRLEAGNESMLHLQQVLQAGASPSAPSGGGGRSAP
jgi:hypothetical protein